jgi:hypothetical protein
MSIRIGTTNTTSTSIHSATPLASHIPIGTGTSASCIGTLIIQIYIIGMVIHTHRFVHKP